MSWLSREKPQLVLCFKHSVKEQALVSEDFNVDSVYRKLLILDQNCWSYLIMYQGSGFLRHTVVVEALSAATSGCYIEQCECFVL